eukprot:Ihof_evm1s1104 gene=Ihof_evmTU1s1104
MVRQKKTPVGQARLKDEAELQTLEKRCKEPFDPEWTRFDQLPLSAKTLEGLKASGFVEMTDIQKTSLPRAIQGLDVLGAAKTGSGKTLAFLIPVLDRLYRLKWSDVFGVGAIIITPTRELAYQIFEVLRKMGRKHTLSAGLIIGGKDVAMERAVIGRMNILIATPGRLQQHMEQTPDFNCDDLQILVLDEADRILDLGFEKSVNAILDNLPSIRQTLLFSATQTKSVRDLARLSLKDPEYVAVHETERFSTPQGLMQTYTVVPLNGKIDLLYAFLRTHTQAKILVFVSSCKQCFISYVRSVFLQANKEVFDVHALPLTNFALSLGLAKPPKVRFVQKAKKQFGSTGEQPTQPKTEVLAKIEKKAEKEATSEEEGDDKAEVWDDGNVSDNDLFTTHPARILSDEDEELPQAVKTVKPKSKTAIAKKLVKKGMQANKKILFDEEGKALGESDSDDDANGGINVEKVARRLRAQDKLDREAERIRIKERHKLRRQKDREARKAATSGGTVVLGGPEGSEDDYEEEEAESEEEIQE